MALLLAFSPSTAWADSFVCPSTYRVIATGDSKEAVIEACGKPWSEKQQKVERVEPTPVVVWAYTVGNPRGKQVYKRVPLLKLLFRDGQVVEVQKQTVAPWASMFVCSDDKTLETGLSMQEILLRCGTPSYVQRGVVGVKTWKEYLIWTYNWGPYKPTLEVQFDEEQVASIQSGPLGQ